MEFQLSELIWIKVTLDKPDLDKLLLIKQIKYEFTCNLLIFVVYNSLVYTFNAKMVNEIVHLKKFLIVFCMLGDKCFFM